MQLIIGKSFQEGCGYLCRHLTPFLMVLNCPLLHDMSSNEVSS